MKLKQILWNYMARKQPMSRVNHNYSNINQKKKAIDEIADKLKLRADAVTQKLLHRG